MFKTLRSRIIASYFIVVFICLLSASLVFSLFLSRYVRDREREDLKKQVATVARDITRINVLVPLLEPARREKLAESPDRLVQNVLNSETQVIRAKLLLVTPGGRVLAEARRRPILGKRQLNLPADLLGEGGAKVSERYFDLLGKAYLVAAAPATVGSGADGFLLAVKPAEETGGVTSSLVWYVVIAGAISLVVSMLIALYLSGAISRPVRAVAGAARRMADGDYSQEVEAKGPVETAELAREFNVMAERVRTAYERQRSFAANVSHELRTPLTSIEGFSQALLDGVSRSEDERRRSLQVINEESRRLVRVLRDILLLSQIDAGELRPEKRPVDIVDLLRKMESVYSARAEEEGVSLTVLAGAASLEANTDPDRLERIMTNLLDNALKYSGAGGTVTLSASHGTGQVDISVTDTGPGIDPELLPRIFERFYRVEESRAAGRGGAGLGLAISKELIESLGGRIIVLSRPGGGTTFTVSLPL